MFEEDDVLQEMFGDIDRDEDFVDGKGFYLGRFSKSDYQKLRQIADQYEPGSQFRSDEVVHEL